MWMFLRFIGSKDILEYLERNELADKVAKRARHRAEMDQHDLIRRPDRSAPFLNIHGLNPYFMKEWNRHWINEGNENHPHQHPKRFICNLIEAQSFEKIVLNRLGMHERRINLQNYYR